MPRNIRIANRKEADIILSALGHELRSLPPKSYGPGMALFLKRVLDDTAYQSYSTLDQIMRQIVKKMIEDIENKLEKWS